MKSIRWELSSHFIVDFHFLFKIFEPHVSFFALFLQWSEFGCVVPLNVEENISTEIKFDGSLSVELFIFLVVVDVFLNKVDELCSGCIRGCRLFVELL